MHHDEVRPKYRRAGLGEVDRWQRGEESHYEEVKLAKVKFEGRKAPSQQQKGGNRFI